jgi:hypothetical protein
MSEPALTRPTARALLAVVVVSTMGTVSTGCAASTASGSAGGESSLSSRGAPPAALETPGARDANLAGTRCRSGAPCICRDPHGLQAENPPPDDQHKRFEIRLGGSGGGAVLDSPTLGHFAGGADQACFYIDVLPGTTSDVTFTAREGTKDGGIGPELDIAEYGPKGPWWYDVLNVRCAGPNSRCNRDAAEAWSAEAKTRKRGRVDPCGSSVISHLQWETSGGVSERELGIFHDFIVKFTMEVKRFPTQWPPHAKECLAGK